MSERRPEGWVIDRANDSDHKKKQPTTTMAMEKTTEKILCLIKENPQFTYRALAETPASSPTVNPENTEKNIK